VKAVDVTSPELHALIREPRPLQLRIVFYVAVILVVLNCAYAYDSVSSAILNAKRVETSHYLLRIQSISAHLRHTYSEELREFGVADTGRVAEKFLERLAQDNYLNYLNVIVPSYLNIRLGGETYSASTGLLNREVSLISRFVESKPVANFLAHHTLQLFTKNLDTFTYTEVESDDYLIGRAEFANGAARIVFAQKSSAKAIAFVSTAKRSFSFALIVVWLGVWFAIIVSLIVGRRLNDSNRAIRLAISSRDRTNSDLENLVTKRTADLSAANAELAAASRAKDEFLAGMSHELRTPLNVILNMSESLQEDVYGPVNEKQERAVRMVEESGRHLLSLVNGILDLAKVRSGTLKLSMRTVIVEDVCNASIRFIEELARTRRLKVVTTFDEQVATIQADERRLKQILVNLLSNAVKFTPEGGAIGLEVTGSPDEGTVCFSVWDTGIGISPEDQSGLFRPFVQLDAGLARNYEGTGLGLSLVAQMTELHGGSVHLESPGYGLGSRFTISLPYSSALIARLPNASDLQLPLNTLPEDSPHEATSASTLGRESQVDSTGKFAPSKIDTLSKRKL
jgi:signal transduction histidine kinase